MSYAYEHVEVLRVLDGDTVELRIDMGNSIHWTGKFRLYGVDTPEVHGDTEAAGQMAADYLRAVIAAFGILEVQTFKPDKFGRWLAKIQLRDGRDVSECLVNAGHAVGYWGGKKA